jgi:hypothetical protein
MEKSDTTVAFIEISEKEEVRNFVPLQIEIIQQLKD